MSKEVIEKLGKNKGILPYTKSLQATGIDGQSVEADSCITLKFSIEGGNPRPYEELFFVRQNVNWQVIVGAKTLATYRIVQHNKHVILPVVMHDKTSKGLHSWISR